jgi:hypothetical protein
MIKNIDYKGFKVEFFICRSGFNTYTITIKKYKDNKKYYFLETLNTYTNKLKEAKKEAFNFIDTLKEINWKWNGLK